MADVMADGVGANDDAGSPAALPEVEAPAAAAGPGVDAVTGAQRRLDELAVLMYTYVGVVQRDAPPAARAPDDGAEAVEADEAARRAVVERVPEYARDLVRGWRAFDEAVGRIEREVGVGGGGGGGSGGGAAAAEDGGGGGEGGGGGGDGDDVREALVRADERCAVVGREMAAEAERVVALLGRVREAIAVTEEDY